MKKWAKSNIGFFFIIPWLIGFLVFKLYPFGSSLVFYSEASRLFETVRAGDLSARALRNMFKTWSPIPSDRPIHPGLGMALPQGFVDFDVLYKVFPTAKEYETRLVKDYEAFVEIADQVGEEIVFSVEEARDIVDMELLKSGRSLSSLSPDEKCELAVQLNRRFRLDALTLSRVLFIPARVISQAIRSKRYNK
jgi:ABC-type sugar transport system permease subunit